MNVMNGRKNRNPMYRKYNLILDARKIHPQKISKNNVIFLTEEDVKKNIASTTTGSVKYGDNMILHNFDSCERELLKKLKGISEI